MHSSYTLVQSGSLPKQQQHLHAQPFPVKATDSRTTTSPPLSDTCPTAHAPPNTPPTRQQTSAEPGHLRIMTEQNPGVRPVSAMLDRPGPRQALEFPVTVQFHRQAATSTTTASQPWKISHVVWQLTNAVPSRWSAASHRGVQYAAQACKPWSPTSATATPPSCYSRPGQSYSPTLSLGRRSTALATAVAAFQRRPRRAFARM